jgi:catechol 2,3-dioxygenase-like lactoylglutathione lyase family enzyme
MRVHHLAFRTRDLPRLEAFYTGVLGFRVRSRQHDYSVWLDAGGAMLMLERAEPGEPDIPRGSSELVAFAVEKGELARHLAKLAAAGVGIEAETAFTIYFRDPDGRRVALSHHPF